MRIRLIALFFAACLAATAQTLTVAQLYTFIENSAKMMREGKQSDRETADFLAATKLSQRLDDATVENMEGLGLGPRTVAALHKLSQQSQGLAPAQPIAPPAPAPVRPPPTSEEQGAIIDEVREYALNYSQDLPDFICTEVQRRYIAAPPGTRYGGPPNSEPSYQLHDTLTIRLSFFEQKEEYKPVLVNGAMTNLDYRALGGTIISGDFGSMLREIFERGTAARFEWDHWGTLHNKPWVMAFAYHVDQSRSQYHVTWDDGKLDIVPAYHGKIYVDPDTHAVMRVTLEPENMPASFPVHSILTTLDYDYVDISGHTFLLPEKDETDSRRDDMFDRVDTEFRLYRKYSAESELKFDTDTPDPLPPEKTQETPVAKPPETPATKPKETPATQPPPKKNN
jgi:hypothetical protein